MFRPFGDSIPIHQVSRFEAHLKKQAADVPATIHEHKKIAHVNARTGMRVR
jgi:hypothetical protein